VTCCSESTIPTIVQSVGVSSRLKGKLASFPRHQNTSSPTPAPTASIATIGFPLGCRFLSTVCTTSNLRPCRESFFTVDTTVPMTRASCIFWCFVLCALCFVLCAWCLVLCTLYFVLGLWSLGRLLKT